MRFGKAIRVLCLICLLLQQSGCMWLGAHQPITNNLPGKRGAGLEWGMTEEEVRGVLGEPDRVWQEPNRIVWHYDEYCLLKCDDDQKRHIVHLFMQGLFTLGLLWLPIPPSVDWTMEFKYGRLASILPVPN